MTQDGLGLNPKPPKFVPRLADLATPLKDAFAAYVRDVSTGAYPADHHNYAMAPGEEAKLKQRMIV